MVDPLLSALFGGPEEQFVGDDEEGFSDLIPFVFGLSLAK